MSNFHFLKDKWPELAECGSEAEQELYTKTKYTYLNTRHFVEIFVGTIMVYENLSNHYREKTLLTNLKTLEHDGVLPIYLMDRLHSIRKSGNKKGAHPTRQGLAGDTMNALRQLFYCYQLGIWLKQTYDDATYEPVSFQIPEKTIDLNSSTIIQQQIEELQEQVKELQSQREQGELNCKIELDTGNNTELAGNEKQIHSRHYDGEIKFTIEGLKQNGFTGFVSIQELWNQGCSTIPRQPGIYAILRDSNDPPEFLTVNTSGNDDKKDPTVAIDDLKKKWVNGAEVLYFGKVGGENSQRTLRDRIGEYLKFGQSRSKNHWGGRYIWQLKGFENLLVAYKPLPNEDPKTIENSMIKEFERIYRKKPYANLQ